MRDYAGRRYWDERSCGRGKVILYIKNRAVQGLSALIPHGIFRGRDKTHCPHRFLRFVLLLCIEGEQAHALCIELFNVGDFVAVIVGIADQRSAVI